MYRAAIQVRRTSWGDPHLIKTLSTTLFERVFAALAATDGPPVVLMLEATPVKAHRSATGGKGGHSTKRPAGPEAGERPKIHVAVDEAEHPRRLILGPGHRGDAPVAVALVADRVRGPASPIPPPAVIRCAPCYGTAAVSRSSRTTRPTNANSSLIPSPTGRALDITRPRREWYHLPSDCLGQIEARGQGKTAQRLLLGFVPDEARTLGRQRTAFRTFARTCLHTETETQQMTRRPREDALRPPSRSSLDRWD